MILLAMVTGLGFVFFLYGEEVIKENVKLYLADFSYNNEKFSCQIKIGDSIIFSGIDISRHKDSLILKEGRYPLEVSSIDGEIIATDTLEIIADSMKYVDIRYKYIPPYNESLKIYKGQLVKHIMERKKYGEAQRAAVIEQLDKQITEEYMKKNSGIVPTPRNFEIEIRNIQYMLD